MIYGRRTIINCQLKSLLKNYLETVIVGFGQVDVLGFKKNGSFIKVLIRIQKKNDPIVAQLVLSYLWLSAKMQFTRDVRNWSKRCKH